jgi:predicted O-methyltransferase YrrM
VGQERWSAVDEYVGGLLAPHDQALEAALRASEEAGLPTIQVSPPQGKLLNLLARAFGAKAILEFGTLGGYSTIWLGRALSDDGRLVTLEADPHYAEVARENIARAGLSDVVDLRVGPALDTLPELEADGAGPFDLTFIDADKVHSPDYFAWALEHSRPGSLIVADNVVRDGTLADPDSDDPKVQAQRRLHEMIAAEPRVDATTIQTVGGKGYDGFAIALVTIDSEAGETIFP